MGFDLGFDPSLTACTQKLQEGKRIPNTELVVESHGDCFDDHDRSNPFLLLIQPREEVVVELRARFQSGAPLLLDEEPIKGYLAWLETGSISPSRVELVMLTGETPSQFICRHQNSNFSETIEIAWRDDELSKLLDR